MKNLLLAVALLIAIGIGYTLFFTPCKIGGRIFRSDLGESVAEAEVRLWTLDRRRGEPYVTAKTKTDKDGRFLFDWLVPGVYRIVIALDVENSDDTPCLSTIGRRNDGWEIVTQQKLSGGYLLVADNISFEMSSRDVWNKDIDLSCK